jgi:glycosyltransferase involved in cell wall biosynthesis
MNAPVVPARPDIGVLALPPEPWSEHWMVRHQVLSRLTRHFRVVWLNPAQPWNALWLPFGRPVSLWKQESPVTGFTVLESGLIVCNPGRWLPEVWRPRPLARWLRKARLRMALSRLKALGCRKIVLYLWKPEEDDALELVPHDLSCYHIFDEYSFSKVELPVDPREARLISAVDRVFICSEAMFRKKGGLNPHATLIPNGVDFKSFSSPVPEPGDLAGIPHPRIGYVGVIKNQLDLDLLSRLAARHPHWQYVLVGPVGNVKGCEEAMAALRASRNVHFLGSKAARELPGYVRHLDACLLCYRVDGYTKFITPLKLNEYLAAGRPVVGAQIEPLLPYADIIRLAGDEAGWSEGLEACLEAGENRPDRIAARQAVAARLDWDGLTDRIAGILREGLDAGGKAEGRP